MTNEIEVYNYFQPFALNVGKELRYALNYQAAANQ